MLTMSLIIVLFNLFISSSHILVDIIQSSDLFALFNYLFVNNILLTSYTTVLAV